MIHELPYVLDTYIRQTLNMQRWFDNGIVVYYAFFIIPLLLYIEFNIIFLIFGHRFHMIKFKLIVPELFSQLLPLRLDFVQFGGNLLYLL